MRWSGHDRGINPGRDGVRVRLQRSLTLHSGTSMATKKKPAARRKANATAAVAPASAVTIAARNLLNMAMVMASCATILLCLMIAKKF